ncbi:MAG: hypothetical protein AB9844_02465 [Clostridiaceae bacterium]
MKNLFKNCLSVLAVFILTVALFFPAAPVFAAPVTAVPISAVASNGWTMENSHWYYYKNGVKVVSQWEMDSHGWCYLGADGSWAKNALVKDSTGLCFIGNDGYWSRSTGWKMDTSTKNWAYIGSNGFAERNTWRQDSKGWCYTGPDGLWAKSIWVADSKGWCFIGENGYWDGKAQIKGGKLSDLNDGAVHSGPYILTESGFYGALLASNPTIINGDVIVVLPNDASSQIDLKNVKINGNLYVYGETGKLNFEGVTSDKLITHGTMRLTGTAKIEYVEINSNVTIFGDGSIEYLILKGQGSNAEITLPSIHTILVEGSAAGSSIYLNSSTTVSMLDILGAADVTGKGTVICANIGASGSSIAMKPSLTRVVPGVTAVVNGAVANDENTNIIEEVPELGTEPPEIIGGGGGGGGTTYSADVALPDLAGETITKVDDTHITVDIPAGYDDSSRLTKMFITTSGYTKITGVDVDGDSYTTNPSPLTLSNGSNTFYIKNVFPVYDLLLDGVTLGKIRSLYGSDVTFTFTTDHGSIVVDVNLP